MTSVESDERGAAVASTAAAWQGHRDVGSLEATWNYNREGMWSQPCLDAYESVQTMEHEEVDDAREFGQNPLQVSTGS